MSKGMQRFVDNFMKGATLGNQIVEGIEGRGIRREKIAADRATAIAMADYRNRRLGVDAAKADAYIEQARANAKYLAAKAGNVGAGKGGSNPGDVEGFLREAGSYGVSAGFEPTPTVNVNPPDTPLVTEPPMSTEEVPAGRRGGRVKKYAQGGDVDNLGSSIGGTAGSIIGSMWGPIGGMVGGEIGKRGGYVVENMIEGDWDDVKEGGAKLVLGPVGDRFAGMARRMQYGGKPLGPGTSGPGSGYGEIAAPPDQAIRISSPPRFQNGGQMPYIDPTGMSQPVEPATFLDRLLNRGRAVPRVGPTRQGGVPSENTFPMMVGPTGADVDPRPVPRMPEETGPDAPLRAPPPPPKPAAQVRPQFQPRPRAQAVTAAPPVQAPAPLHNPNAPQMPTRTLPPSAEPMGGSGLDPQGANTYGAGLSTNNAYYDYLASLKGGAMPARYQQGGHVADPVYWSPGYIDPAFGPYGQRGPVQSDNPSAPATYDAPQRGYPERYSPTGPDAPQRTGGYFPRQSPNPAAPVNFDAPQRGYPERYSPTGPDAPLFTGGWTHGAPQPGVDPNFDAPQRGSYPGGMPRQPVNGGAGAGASAGQAITLGPPGRKVSPGAGRRPLRDQQRTEAYDPTLDNLDPDNWRHTGPGGEPSAFARQRVPVDPAKEMMQGANNWANFTYGTSPQGKMARNDGKDAATPQVVQQAFQLVDPQNKMPMQQKMEAATSAAYQHHVQRGDKATADQSVYEMVSFGVNMGKQHGAQAMKALQGGNVQAAIQNLLDGYNWLPDGHTASVQGNNIVLVDKNGQPSMTIPIQPGTIQNLALGMMTGQLGWDVVGMRSGAGTTPAATPPPSAAAPQPAAVGSTSRPSAQPQAASAGPVVPPPAAPSSPVAGGPAPSVASGTPRPTPSPAPTTAQQPQGQARGKVEGAVAKAGALDTSVPAKIAGGAGVSGGDLSGGPGGDVVHMHKPQEVAQAPSDLDERQRAEKAHFDKNPWAPLPQIHRETAQDPVSNRQYQARVQAAEAKFQDTQQRLLALGQKYGLKGRGTQALNASLRAAREVANREIAQAKADFDNARNFQQQGERYDIQTELKPRSVSVGDEDKFNTRFDAHAEKIIADAKRGPTRRDEAGKAAAASRQKTIDNSVLRSVAPKLGTEPMIRSEGKEPVELSTLKSIARNIWQSNNTLSAEEAFDLALQATSIMPPDRDGKPVRSPTNYQTGKDALHFQPAKYSQRRNQIVLKFPTKMVQVSLDTYNDIKAVHRANWADWEKGEKARKEQEAQDKKHGGSAGKAIMKGAAAGSNVLFPGMPNAPSIEERLTKKKEE